ncbi:hypothetical protein SO802_031948 [Lithocarpus litseifolius]|uniref:CCHC-type domain-containing protein n=1 Tax=Lithocarpus litseifolius TaxID=425828 RepID=A0AAW2BMI9_9ROSI
MDSGEDSADNWDNKVEYDEVEPGQMGGDVMNSDCESEELLSLDESSSSSEHCNDSSDGDTPTDEVDNSIRRSKFPIFGLVAKAENLRFKKDMLFLSPKQFKDAMTDYAVHGGWGIKFVKNNLVRVRARCQAGCKFFTYLAKVPREKSFRLKTLNMEHTYSRSYRNPRCTASYIGKKLMKRDAVHEKYVIDISAGKVIRAREKAQEVFDRVHTAQFNQLWKYCDELRRCNPGSTILIKVHTYNDGDLAAEHNLATELPYFLKCIRPYLMTRFQANRQMIMKVESESCPKIRKRLYKEKLACTPYQEETSCLGRPKKKRALEPDEPRSHRKNRGASIPKQCKACGKLGHSRRSCKREVGGSSSLPRSASQVNKTIRRETKDRHANSIAVGSAQPSSNAQPTVHKA